MTEIHETEAPVASPLTRRLRVKPTDIIAFAVIIIAVVSMSVFIVNRLKLKHEVANAKVVSSKVVDALSTQNTAAIRALGDKSFQTKNSAKSLDTALTFHPENSDPIKFSQLYGDDKPTVDRQIVTNNSRGQHVVFIYEYNKLKVPFYVRVDTNKVPNADKWTLQGLSASSTESNLLQ